MKYIFALMLVLAVVFAFPSPTFAAKKRARAAGAIAPKGATYSTARLNRPGHSVVVTFVNLKSVSRIEYALSYKANGVEQGAMGSFTPSGQGSDSRDLYFGTCSHGVCTPHYGITGATLVVTTTLTGGSTNVKRYTIKSI